MWEDPIVSEVRRVREDLSAKFDFDVKAIFSDLRRRQAALGPRLVSPKQRIGPSLVPAAQLADHDSTSQIPSVLFEEQKLP